MMTRFRFGAGRTVPRLPCPVMDPLDLPVPTAPDAPDGVAWLRSHVARFSNGETHRRRRALAVDELSRIDVRDFARTGHPVAVLAAAMGVRVDPADVELVASAYHPHLPIPPGADAAVARLAAACGGGRNERVAARVGLLVQACPATLALLAAVRSTGRAVADVLREDPPVRTTRRGEQLVPLDGRPFGAGAHACPGQEHALTLVRALAGSGPPTGGPP